MSAPLELVSELIRQKITIATAESLTAGMVAASLAEVSGVSAVLQGGIVAYQNRVKTSALAVPAELLETQGSVDGDVARCMALGACAAFGAELGIATTGAAGPEPHDGKPAGTVFVAVAFRGETKVQEHHFDGDRQQIRQQAVRVALKLAADVVHD